MQEVRLMAIIGAYCTISFSLKSEKEGTTRLCYELYSRLLRQLLTHEPNDTAFKFVSQGGRLLRIWRAQRGIDFNSFPCCHGTRVKA